MQHDKEENIIYNTNQMALLIVYVLTMHAYNQTYIYMHYTYQTNIHVHVSVSTIVRTS